MPLGKNRLWPEIAEFRADLTVDEVELVAADPVVRTLQTSGPVPDKTWELLNNELVTHRPDIKIRVYGFYGDVCDLSFTRHLTNVRRFAADSLMDAVGVESVPLMERLESLDIGVYSLENFSFLRDLNPSIRSLGLCATKSRTPRIDLLGRFRSLKELYLEGQYRGIEAMSSLESLEKIVLRSISTDDVEYLAPLQKVKSLDIKLGGIRNLSAIAGKESIEYLELWQIRGLRDISVISTLSGLQSLYLQSLRNVVALPDLSGLQELRKICLENLKALVDVAALLGAPALERLVHIGALNFEPSDYETLLSKESLRTIHVGFGSKRKNTEFKNMAKAAGKSSPENVPIQAAYEIKSSMRSDYQ